MKKEYARRSGENYFTWLERVHNELLKSESIDRADPDLVAILINNIPRLISLATNK